MNVDESVVECSSSHRLAVFRDSRHENPGEATMATCTHPQIEPAGELLEDLHYEDWRCLECGTLIYGPCHHQSLCRIDFCGLSAEPVMPTRVETSVA